jgi:hypothetical protein
MDADRIRSFRFCGSSISVPERSSAVPLSRRADIGSYTFSCPLVFLPVLKMKRQEDEETGR